MDIYKIYEDFNFKDFSFETNEFNSYKGQSIIDNWKVPNFFMLEDKLTNKSELLKEKNKNSNFDARCYGSNLLVKSKFNSLFSTLPIETLDIDLKNNNESFSFYNVTNIVKSISFKGLDFKASMNMIKSNNIEFIYKNIKKEIIFRDEKITNFYYCTERFIEIFNTNNIEGLSFIKVGNAK